MPPFVGTDAIDPNVLLMIDNSASMLDLAAVGEEGVCYDGTEKDENGVGVESYESDTVYSGYFRTYIDPAIDPANPLKLTPLTILLLLGAKV